MAKESKFTNVGEGIYLYTYAVKDIFIYLCQNAENGTSIHECKERHVFMFGTQAKTFF